MKKVLKAFTLVEVMCVVTILAIVSVVAVPSISGYIDHYNQRVCKSAVSDMIEDIKVNCVKNRIMFDSDYKNVNSIITETIKANYTDGVLDDPLYDNGSFSVATDSVCPQNETYNIKWSVTPDDVTEPTYADVRISAECEEHGSASTETFRIVYKTFSAETGRRQIKNFPEWVSVYETFIGNFSDFRSFKAKNVDGKIVAESGTAYFYNGTVNYNGTIISSPAFGWDRIYRISGNNVGNSYVGSSPINYYAFAQSLKQSSSLYSDGYIIDEDLEMYDVEIPGIETSVKNWWPENKQLISPTTGIQYSYGNEWKMLQIFEEDIFFNDVIGMKQHIAVDGKEYAVSVRKNTTNNTTKLNVDEYGYYVGQYEWAGYRAYRIRAFYHKDDKAWYKYKSWSDSLVRESEFNYVAIRDDIEAHKVGDTNTKFEKIIQY